MTDDDIPEGKAIRLTPTTRWGKLLIAIDKKGWTKRFLVKGGAAAASFATGWIAGHGGQDYADEIGMGVAAAVVFFGEAAWSWMVMKSAHTKIDTAMNMPSVQEKDKPEWLDPKATKSALPPS